MLKLNEGNRDRAVRLTLGVLFGAVAVTGTAGAALTSLTTVAAVILFVTAATGFCPLYGLLGIDTADGPVEG